MKAGELDSPMVSPQEQINQLRLENEALRQREAVWQRDSLRLAETDVLLKELQHRFKNSLHLICSLLELQISHGGRKNAETILQDCYQRIRTVALVHERLNLSPGTHRVDFKDYLEHLGGELIRSYGNPDKPITWKWDLAPLTLNMKQAIPCGLIVHELISNSLKYAFAAGQRGQIALQIKHSRPREVEMVVSDNGIGLPQSINIQEPPTLGLKLVQLLARQIQAEMELERTGGTKFQFRFTQTE